MKLEKYQDKNKKNKKVILISLGVIVLISISLLLYKTFASFSESTEFQVMKGKVDYFGNSDVYFVFYQGDKELEEMPQKDNAENLVFDHGECDNGATIEWDSNEWAPLVKNLKYVKTKCSLYFDKATPIVEYLTNLAKTDTINLMYDGKESLGEELGTDDNNLRYVGSSPNNYIDIGNRDSDGKPILWRVIGVMNNITNLDNNGQQESLVKIIRAESIGDYTWDSSISTINIGRGVNEWSEADLMKLLNPQEVYKEIPTIGASLYWNRGSGSCYSDKNETVKECNFITSGLNDKAKEKIAKIKWNTGTVVEANINEKMTASYMYDGERSSHNGKEQCLITGEAYTNGECNDNVTRNSTWDGYIGLMYSSDYGYAIGGNIRNECLAQSMRNWENFNCTSNWMKKGGYPWMMTVVPHAYSAYYAFVNEYSNVIASSVNQRHSVYPVAYLKSNTKIFVSSNSEKEYGSIDNPFRISL